MKSIKISGTVEFINLAMGFWAILGDDGEKYRPVHMPDQLKKEGKKIICRIKPIDEEFSIMMWGKPVKVVSFET
ncbi:MAG: hypothetical protein KA143_01895 [Saprospiraceae bacterium]|nr:hypothetical protein [Saprospiraceae bacterium]